MGIAPNGEPYLTVSTETLDGAVLRFTIEDDVKPNCSGFVVDQIKAWINNEAVGFINVEYLEEDAFKAYYPSGVFNYMALILGAAILPYEHRNMNLEYADAKMLNHVGQRLVQREYAIGTVPKMDDFADFQLWFNAVKNDEKFGLAQDQYEGFKQKINKPWICYVCTDHNRANGINGDNQRRGIGTALYKVASIVFGERDMRVKASTLQSDSARNIWLRLEKEGMAYKEAGSMYLDPKSASVDLEIRKCGPKI